MCLPAHKQYYARCVSLMRNNFPMALHIYFFNLFLFCFSNLLLSYNAATHQNFIFHNVCGRIFLNLNQIQLIFGNRKYKQLLTLTISTDNSILFVFEKKLNQTEIMRIKGN